MRQFWHFLQYHNAVPLAVTIMVMGAGATFAATNPDAIYSSSQQYLSIDNSYIANKDLSSWSPQIRIGSVTEDAENYYVAYQLSTIDIDTYAWKDVVKSETMTVSKADLGPYRDLGVYVTGQLRQIIDREHQRLVDTQEIERKSMTAAVLATSYGGLIGQFLDDSTETLPGYTPVVTPPSQSLAGSYSEPAAGGTAQSGGGSSTSGSSTGGTSLKIGLQLLGNNPARIELGASYIDLGAALIDPYKTNVGIHAFQNGTEVITPTIDTSTTSAQTIEYRATDPSGNTITVRRVVLIGGAADPGGEINEAGNVAPVPPPQEEPAMSTTETPAAATTTSSTSASSTTETAATSTAPQSDTATTTAPQSSTATSTESSAAEPAATTSSTTAPEPAPVTSATPIVDSSAASSTATSTTP